MFINIKPVDHSGIVLKADGDKVMMSGSISVQEPRSIMSPFLNDVHNTILSLNMKSIKVDISKLDFLNSSGIREIVDWIMKLDVLPKDKKYKIRFICNKEILWQETSISTLEFLNTDFISKEFI